MASIHRLTTKQINHTKKPLNDGGNLWLIVTGDSKKWVFRKTIAGRAVAIGLGGYPETGLAAARADAEQCREWIKAGLDPLQERRRIKQERENPTHTPTFTQAAARFILTNRHQWKSRKHTLQWISTLRQHARPVIGSMPVDQITIQDIQRVLNPIWNTIPETAKRVQGRVERVLDWATVQRYREGENPARWRGRLDKIYPATNKLKKQMNGGRERHHKAMPYTDLPDFWKALQERKGISPVALRFAILTACRSGEVLGAEWSEIDLDSRVWVIPAGRMKAGVEHRVPLTEPMVDLLQSLPRLNQWVFPSNQQGKHLSNMAMLKVLRDMGYGKDGQSPPFTVHGMRSAFRDWCEEQSSFPHGVIEKALAHAISNATERAYNRADLFEKRRKLMEAWGNYVLPAIAENVLKLPNVS